MSAKLSSPISSVFAEASDFEKFFGLISARAIRRNLESREQPVLGVPGESCKTNLFFGFFFDGTKNNYIQAEVGKNHSNVARLYDCYPGLSVPGVLPKATDWQANPERYTHFFKVYIPGVASPFPQIRDSGEGFQETQGAAAGALGERRIVWALIQAVNNLHRYFLKKPLIGAEEANSLLAKIELNKYARALMEPRGFWAPKVPKQKANSVPREEFRKILVRLHAAIAPHIPDKRTGKPAKIDPAVVKTIYVSVFGFSRGATQARAFLNWFQSLCKLDAELRGKAGEMSLGGFRVEFDFMGLFDTVASVGLGNTLGNSILGVFFDGHGAWADTEDSLRIPPGVKCVHLAAAHELRRSFPLDSISVKGTLPDGCEEIIVPGVHSDLGCGYSPCEQGRGTSAIGDDMLARIPLLIMYKAARLNGVPLKLEMASQIAKERFKLTPETINAYNAYIETCKEVAGPIHKIMREQARKQMEWRLFRRVTGKNPLQASESYRRASTFDQNDLLSAGREFEKEIAEFLAWVKDQGNGFRPTVQEPGFDNEHLSEWEEIATWWGKAQPSQPVIDFFDNYVHDSRAWFKLIPGNPDNEKGLHELLKRWVKKRRAVKAYNEMNAKIQGNKAGSKGSAVALGSFHYRHVVVSDGLSADEARAADEYAKTGKIPTMMTTGREPFSASWDSWWLSGRAGYLRYRKIYGGFDSELLSSAPVDDANTVFVASADKDAAAAGAQG